jgi:hypothetical protein
VTSVFLHESKVTGIMMDSSSNSTTDIGSDSKMDHGSNMERQCQSNQTFPED